MKDKKVIMHIIFVVFAVLGLALASQISFNVPIGQGIPITGQSFAILLIGYFLPIRTAFFSVLLYIMLGVVGLPFFANGSSGFDIIIGKSGGYIIGFLPAVCIVSNWEYGKFNNLIHSLQTLVFSTGIILLFGVLRLSVDVGFPMAIEYGLKPFWVGAILKILLALFVIYFYLKIRHKT